MKDLNFRDALEDDRFRSNNGYHYTTRYPTNILYPSKARELPFITKSGLHEDTNGLKVIHFAKDPWQFNRKALTSKKLVEVMNGAKMPIIVKFGGAQYMAGKGFLASYFDDEIKVIFLATYNTAVSNLTMADIHLYISRDVYLPAYKKVLPVLQAYSKTHPGELTITNKMSDHVGFNITLDKKPTISATKQYNQELLDTCLKGAAKTLK